MSPLVQESCQDILDTMPASAILIRFGLAGDPLASVTTPYTFMSRESHSGMEEKVRIAVTDETCRR